MSKTTKTKTKTNSNSTSTRTHPDRKLRPRRSTRDTRSSGADMSARRNIEPLRRRQQDQDRPALRFAPDAWAKLLWLRDRGSTEVGGFGITDREDPLRVIEFATVRQHCTAASVGFEDEAVADFFEDQWDAGRRPEQCGRVWLHSHPGESANPSALDEATFARVFGGCDWAVMFIIAKGGATYARLRCNVGPGMAKRLPVRVDYSPPFGASDVEAWESEYQTHIQTMPEEMFDPFDLDAAETDPLPGEAAWLDQFAIDAEVLALLGETEHEAEEVPFTDVELDMGTEHEEKEDA